MTAEESLTMNPEPLQKTLTELERGRDCAKEARIHFHDSAGGDGNYLAII
jgi:hypothetical protein